MNYENTNNNKDYVNKVSTQGTILWNSKGPVQSALALNFYNEYASMTFHKRTSTDNGPKFNMKEGVLCSLDKTNMMRMIVKIETEILPAIENGTQKSFAVPVAANSAAFVISTGVKKYGHVQPYVAICNELNEQRIPSKIDEYCFDIEGVIDIDNYDEVTGECTTSYNLTAEVQVFLRYLKEALRNALGGNAHAIRYFDRFYRNRLMNNGSGNSGYRSNYNNRGGSGAFAPTGGAEDEAPFKQGGDLASETNINNVDALDDFMNN